MDPSQIGMARTADSAIPATRPTSSRHHQDWHEPLASRSRSQSHYDAATSASRPAAEPSSSRPAEEKDYDKLRWLSGRDKPAVAAQVNRYLVQAEAAIQLASACGVSPVPLTPADIDQAARLSRDELLAGPGTEEGGSARGARTRWWNAALQHANEALALAQRYRGGAADLEAKAQLMRGQVLRGMGRKREAYNAYVKAASRNPALAWARDVERLTRELQKEISADKRREQQAAAGGLRNDAAAGESSPPLGGSPSSPPPSSPPRRPKSALSSPARCPSPPKAVRFQCDIAEERAEAFAFERDERGDIVAISTRQSPRLSSNRRKRRQEGPQQQQQQGGPADNVRRYYSPPPPPPMMATMAGPFYRYEELPRRPPQHYHHPRGPTGGGGAPILLDRTPGMGVMGYDNVINNETAAERERERRRAERDARDRAEAREYYEAAQRQRRREREAPELEELRRAEEAAQRRREDRARRERAEARELLEEEEKLRRRRRDRDRDRGGRTGERERCGPGYESYSRRRHPVDQDRPPAPADERRGEPEDRRTESRSGRGGRGGRSRGHHPEDIETYLNQF